MYFYIDPFVYDVSTDAESPVPQARVFLKSLLGLLQKCEDDILNMLETVETIDLPSGWEGVDIIKQTVSLMVSAETTLVLTGDHICTY